MSEHALFLTNYIIAPAHPRVAAALCELQQAKLATRVISIYGQQRRGVHLLRLMTFMFFDLHALFAFHRQIAQADFVYILGMKLLLAAINAKLLGKRVIYETLDNEPALHAYRLKQHRWLRWLGHLSPVRWLAELVEKGVARWCCDEVIVNGDALATYFGGRANILFYYSPFESLNVDNDVQKPPALLYLGFFSADKGAAETLALAKHHRLPLYIFGEIPETGIREQIKADDATIYWTPRLGADNLAQQIVDLMQTHYLIGTSIIHPVHHSYATQEANKDIDYLALGIPILGNTRVPTKEKLDVGCGVYYDDAAAVTKLLRDPSFAASTVAKCRTYYNQHYARQRYEKQFRAVLARTVLSA